MSSARASPNMLLPILEQLSILRQRYLSVALMGYTGERSSQGEAHGQGTQTWPNGDRYEGTWQDGKRHGTGKSTLANGERYVGPYANDRRHGKVRARERQPRIRLPA